MLRTETPVPSEGRDLVLSLENTPDPLPREAAGAALYEHNIRYTGVADRRPIAALARNATTGEVTGGLWGRTELGLLLLDLFFLPREERGREIGARLARLVEVEAMRRGCRPAVAESNTFQASSFYLDEGYEELGRVPLALAGHARIFLSKRLA